MNSWDYTRLLERLEQSYVCAADCQDYEACEILIRKIGEAKRKLSPLLEGMHVGEST